MGGGKKVSRLTCWPTIPGRDARIARQTHYGPGSTRREKSQSTDKECFASFGTGLTVESSMFDKRENQLLAALDPTDYALLRPHLSTACFARGAMLQEQEAPVVQVYFPLSGLVSLVSVMEDGHEIETAVIGRDGAVGAFVGLGRLNAFA